MSDKSYRGFGLVNKGSREENRRPGRPKKRKFYGERKKSPPNPNEEPASTSARKLRDSGEFIPAVKADFCYVLLEFFTVFCTLSDFVKCKKCDADVKFEQSNNRGLGFNLRIKCDGCKTRFIPSCPLVNKAYEVNTRIVFAMRMLGIAHSGLKLFCGLMDMCRPIAKTLYVKICARIRDASKKIADQTMEKAAKEEQKLTTAAKDYTNPKCVTVSTDGSWMKRGFSSLFGIVAVIGVSSGQLLDCVVKSAYCKVSEIWDKRANVEEYAEEYDDYVNFHYKDCQANHEGSSGSMEVAGTSVIFHRSLEKHDLMYAGFLGDGDSSTFKTVSESMPYGEDCAVKKKECVGHVGKRMGGRLKRLVSKTKGLQGRGKLTGKEILKLQMYYGNAIRGNSDTVKKMQDAIWATYYHRSSTDDKPQHHLCLPHLGDGLDEKSWCGWQIAQAKGEVYTHPPPFPPAVLEAIRPIYTELSDPELLERCLGGLTQNNNESFNATEWKLCPKVKFSGTVIVETATYLAAAIFNQGFSPIMAVLAELGITVGERCLAECQVRDRERVAHAHQRPAWSRWKE